MLIKLFDINIVASNLAGCSNNFKMSLEERKKIKRVSFPYGKLEVDGKVIYRRFEDLTQEERNSLNC